MNMNNNPSYTRRGRPRKVYYRHSKQSDSKTDTALLESGLPPVRLCGRLYVKCPNPHCYDPNFATRKINEARKHCE